MNATTMSPLSDEYLRSLEPETMRYDVTIFDDFVLSVLPNGLKTWAFLYEHDGRTRRKTLGVYPDMNYEQAEDALDHARSMILKLGDDIKDSPVEPDTPRVEVPPEAIIPPPPPEPPIRPAVLASRRARRSYTSAGSSRRSVSPRALRIGGIALAGVLVVALGAFVLPRMGFLGEATDAAPSPAEERPGRAAPKPIVVDAAPEAEIVPSPAPEPEPASDPSPVAAAPESATTPVEPVASAQPEPEEPVAVRPQVEPVASAQPEPEEPVAVSPPPVEAPPPVQVAIVESDRAPPPVTAQVTASQPESAPTASAAGDVARVTAPESATSTGGKVTRAVVSSGVENIEPVDDLGADIALLGGGFRTVFYFTELRGFTAGNIVHRWTYNGRVIADVPLKVGGAWRWRTYSSKDLLPGMTGDWEVSVIDGDGRVLGVRRFRYDL